MSAALSDRSSRGDNVTSARMGQKIAIQCARSGRSARCTTSIRWQLRWRRGRDFVKSAAERARCWAGEAHRGRGSAWPLSMRRERRPRSNVEVEASAGPVWRGRRTGECGRQQAAAVITPKFVLGFKYKIPILNSTSRFFLIVVSLLESLHSLRSNK